jgi:hypothetical protein
MPVIGSLQKLHQLLVAAVLLPELVMRDREIEVAGRQTVLQQPSNHVDRGPAPVERVGGQGKPDRRQWKLQLLHDAVGDLLCGGWKFDSMLQADVISSFDTVA